MKKILTVALAVSTISVLVSACASTKATNPAPGRDIASSSGESDCLAQYEMKLGDGSIKSACLQADKVETEQFTSDGREVRNVVVREPKLVIPGRFLKKSYFMDREGDLATEICTKIFNVPYVSEGLLQYKKAKHPISAVLKNGMLFEHEPDTSLNRFEYVYYYKTLVCSTEQY